MTNKKKLLVQRFLTENQSENNKIRTMTSLLSVGEITSTVHHSRDVAHHVILLTECWTNQFSEITVNNFESFVLHRQENKKNSKRNSGGIVLYIRNKYVSDDTLIFTSHDDILWVKISSSVLSLNNDLYICLCYVVPDETSG